MWRLINFIFFIIFILKFNKRYEHTKQKLYFFVNFVFRYIVNRNNVYHNGDNADSTDDNDDIYWDGNKVFDKIAEYCE